MADFNEALNPGAHPDMTTTSARAASNAAPADNSGPAPTDSPAPAPAPLQLQDVPAAGADAGSGASVMTSSPATTGSSGASMGAEILTPSAQPRSTDDTGGLKAVGPVNATALPPIEKPAAAPDAVNDIQPGTQNAAQAAPANGKKAPKPAFDKGDESSSKHKKKKGLAKVNPF